ncbi:PREDICTED: DNA/RNA-binding protein KIN17 isoform X2 [Calidris pugnax]|uniref:DNA/RNA-binding protein KIN17 isoform X2 n=1 Tax=Calidris pugnax TaxID=198806 RepID=UPI00071C9636|nr:PREDICTED: DNA/RNA-binding protein KIN17 isoform X2 [Calidris pugnax]
MGKSDFLSPKAIANRIKSKGLQKLRWYCQMCQKQCRDENGFKCHCMSESHQRQLLLASENPQQFMDYFSEEFRNDFLELLRRRFGTKRVHNNIVYNEYISHREHIHMNATQWETLTDFTKWLGREGLCKVDETPKGWYIQYIDRDPETIRRQQEQERKKKQDLDDEEKTAKFIEQQVRRGLEGKELEQPVYTELNRENEEEKVAFNLNKGASTSIAASSKTSVLGPSALKMVEGAVKRKEPAHSSGQSKEKKKKSALDEIMELEEEKKRTSRRDYWLQPEIVVKIVTKKLGEKYHKKKAVVKVKRANSWASLVWGNLGSFVSLCKLFTLKSTLMGAEMSLYLYWDLFWAGSESLNWFNVIYSVILSSALFCPAWFVPANTSSMENSCFLNVRCPRAVQFCFNLRLTSFAVKCRVLHLGRKSPRHQ